VPDAVFELGQSCQMMSRYIMFHLWQVDLVIHPVLVRAGQTKPQTVL